MIRCYHDTKGKIDYRKRINNNLNTNIRQSCDGTTPKNMRRRTRCCSTNLLLTTTMIIIIKLISLFLSLQSHIFSTINVIAFDTTTTTIQTQLLSNRLKHYHHHDDPYNRQCRILSVQLLQQSRRYSYNHNIHHSYRTKATILHSSILEATYPTSTNTNPTQSSSSTSSLSNTESNNENDISIHPMTSDYNNQQQLQQVQQTPVKVKPTLGNELYKCVQWFGKKLTFQASKPKNSIYFFGTNRNNMHHYYQTIDNKNIITPSQRLFRVVDDILHIDTNDTIENPVKTSSSTSLLPKPALGSERAIQTLWNRQQRQQQQEQQQHDDNEINLVFDKDNFKQQVMEEEKQVWEALVSLEKDMSKLDRMIGTKPQLSTLQFILLGSAVLSTATSPLLFTGQLTEFVAPSMAAFTAAIGIAAEYRGRVAVADSKEVAAASLQCAAEAEGYLASAERAKAVR
jgi:hypothetical protein